MKSVYEGRIFTQSPAELQRAYNAQRTIEMETLLLRPLDKWFHVRLPSRIMRVVPVAGRLIALCEDGGLWRVMLGAKGALRKQRQAWTAEIQRAFEGGT